MNKKELSYEELSNNKKEYVSDKKNTVIRNALSHNTFNEVFHSLDNAENNQFVFSIDVKTLPVTNQRRSGRCWIFSACNVLREIIAKKANIKGQFELSQNYVSYYDKLEKYNYYAQNLIDLFEKGVNKEDRKVSFLLDGVGDGGQWQMFVNLVKKYGVMPKGVFSETAQSNETMGSNRLLNATLRKFAADIYHDYQKNHNHDNLMKLKEEYNKKVFNILTSSFGVPPTEFDFEYINNNDEYVIEKGYTPKSFFEKYIGNDIDDFVSLINAPTLDKKYNNMYTVEFVGNVYGDKDVTHLNVSFDRMEEMIIAQLKDNEIVWFGSDVSFYGNRDKGIWDDKAYNFLDAFNTNLSFDKADMLDFKQSMMNHAMCIIGVDIKDGKPVRWKIENSWGDEAGNKGIYMMSESFFRLFVYQAAVRKKYLNNEELKALEKEIEVLPPWDPFGTLAD